MDRLESRHVTNSGWFKIKTSRVAERHILTVIAQANAVQAMPALLSKRPDHDFLASRTDAPPRLSRFISLD
jgi:hypothetical protein